MNTDLIDQKMIEGVVLHMNEDHSDACLVIARFLGSKPKAQAASMTGMDSQGMDLEVTMSDGSSEPTRVIFEKPITRDSQIRGHIVALTKIARARSQNNI